MKLKLTSSEFLALNSLLQHVVIGKLPKGIQETVLHGTLFRLYKRFHARELETKRQYTFTIPADEACAFHLFFSRSEIMVNLPDFTVNLVHSINNHVHNTYSK